MTAENYRRMIKFLEDGVNLDALLAGPAQVFDYVIQTRPENIVIKDGARIDSFVKLEGGEGLHIGRFVHVASYAHVGIGGGTTVIDDFAAIASGAKVISGSNQMDAPSMSACAPAAIQRVERKITRISRYAVVLVGAIVGPGVTLGEGAVLGAGAVTMKDIPAWEVWVGNPARFLRKREVQR